MAQVTRRDFLAASSLFALAGRRTLADEPKTTSANDAVTLGFIGLGGMGSGLLNIFKGFPDVRVAVVCDIDESHARRAREAADGKPEIELDFRRVLDRKDVDAVVIATPDHWHAIPTILACQAGKDVYCEKPLTHNIGEGRRVADAVAKYQRVTQMGNLIHASETYHRMVEIVQSGVLGSIRKTQIWMPGGPNSIGKPADTAPPPGVDYDVWLGPAPKRPFNPNRFHFTWRYFWDYAGGQLGDFICHLADPVLWAMKAQSPASVVAEGRREADDNAETPDVLEVVWTFPEGFELVWNSSPKPILGRGAGVAFYGENAILHGHYNDYKIIPAEGKDKVEFEEPPKTLPRSVGHHREWLDAIKSRAQCSCNFAYGHQLSSLAHLGNISLKTGRRLDWNGADEQFPNDADANRMILREEYRTPWALPQV